MSEKINISLTRKEFEYDIEICSTQDIIENITTDVLENKLYNSIVKDLEFLASNTIKNMECANIPYIGSIRINPVRRALKDKKLHLNLARKKMTKEEYKEYVGSYVVELQEKQRKKDANDVYLKKVMRNNKHIYDKLFIKLGKGYANMFVYAITLLDEVPFDAEWEEQYQSLKD